MSAESGLKTFRDSGGLWESYDVNEVATPEAWQRNPELVLEFYNKRRDQVLKAVPNHAHKSIAKLEEKFIVDVVTQNIDDLHERAGSSRVLHLHGEILKAKSINSEIPLYDVRAPLEWGKSLAEDGSQLRPHIVWFGEPVPEYDNAQRIISKADILIIVGTSLNVFPAAGLVFHAQKSCKSYLVDPNELESPGLPSMHLIQKPATIGIPRLVEELLGTAKLQDA